MKRNWKEEIENIERKIEQEIALEDDRNYLTFVEAGDRCHRILNKKTNRFHDLELGIDVLTDENGKIL